MQDTYLLSTVIGGVTHIGNLQTPPMFLRSYYLKMLPVCLHLQVGAALADEPAPSHKVVVRKRERVLYRSHIQTCLPILCINFGIC